MVETLHAASVVANDGCVNPTNLVGAPDDVWTGNTGGSDWSARWALDTPVDPLADDTHAIDVLVRRTTESTRTPSVDVELWVGDTLVATIANNLTVTSTTGQVVSGTFGGTDLPDVVVAGSSSGGPGNQRTTVQADAVTVEAVTEEESTDQHESGGSDALVSIASSGGGTAAESAQGGADGVVSVDTTGGGSAAEASQGGSDGVVVIAATGGGVDEQGATEQHESGGSDALIAVAAQGGGQATEAAQGGADGLVLVAATGGGEAEVGGEQHESGGSDALVAVASAGGGTGSEVVAGGSDGVVVITATGGGGPPGLDQAPGQQKKILGAEPYDEVAVSTLPAIAGFRGTWF